MRFICECFTQVCEVNSVGVSSGNGIFISVVNPEATGLGKPI